MKKRAIPILLTGLLLSLGTALAQDADEIIARGLKAINAQKLSSTKSIRYSGTASFSGGVVSGPFTMTQVRPNWMRFETDLSGSTLIQAYDGKEAWGIFPPMAGGSGKPEPLPEGQARSAEMNAEYDSPMMTYQRDGHRVELVGREEVEGKSVFHIKLIRSDAPEIHYYLNADDYMLIKQTTTQPNPSTGGNMEVETWTSDYREVSGVLIAHHIEARSGGMVVNEMTIDKVEFDFDVDPALFKRPAAEASSGQR